MKRSLTPHSSVPYGCTQVVLHGGPRWILPCANRPTYLPEA
jgi:hypothetical protein